MLVPSTSWCKIAAVFDECAYHSNLKGQWSVICKSFWMSFLVLEVGEYDEWAYMLSPCSQATPLNFLSLLFSVSPRLVSFSLTPDTVASCPILAKSLLKHNGPATNGLIASKLQFFMLQLSENKRVVLWKRSVKPCHWRLGGVWKYIISRTPNWWKCEHPIFTISFDTRYVLAILKHAIEDDWFLLTLPVLFRSGSLDLVPFTQVQRHRVPGKVTITWSSCGCATFPSCYDQTSKTAKQWPNIQLLARGQ